MTKSTRKGGEAVPGLTARRLVSLRPHHLRLIGGLAMVGVSVGGVWLLVQQTTSSVDYLVTTQPVLQGTPIGEVEWATLALSAEGQTLPFLRPSDLELAEGHVFRTDLPAGSPVSADQLRKEEPTDYTTFTITIALGGAPWLYPGSSVEVWTSPPQADQTFSVPVVVSPLALVTGVRVDEGFAADSSMATVDLLVHRREVPELIHARANGFDIQLSPVAGQWGEAR